MIRALLGAAVIAVAAIGAAPTASADPMSDLIGLLPPGYGPDSCQPEQSTGRALALLRCGPNSSPGGPTQALYMLYPDLQAMANQFQHTYDELPNHVPCPGGTSTNPATINSGPHVVGNVACGDGPPDGPTVMWSNNADSFVAKAWGDNGTLADLFAWFKSAARF